MAKSSPDGQAGTVELLWGLRRMGTRGPKPALTLERIADAAVDVADADGLAAVSMQRVAERLDVTKMALYRYVVSKSELLAIMIEQAVEEPPDLNSVPGGWRPKLQGYARRLWAIWDRHRWLPEITTGDRVMGPREFAWTECAMAALAGTGLSARERLDAVVLLSGHIRNTRSPAAAGTQPWTGDRQMGLLHDYGERFPEVVRAVASGVDGSVVHTDDVREFGLECILDGLAMRIAHASST